jgi:PAS domain S-box-containing protein
LTIPRIEHKEARNPLEHTVTTLNQESIFELASDSVMTRTMEGTINFWNHSAEELYGWKKEEAIGKVSHSLLQTQFPKPLEEIESELIQSGRWEGKLVHTTRDGGRVVVESRWTLDVTGQSEAIIEINACSTDHEIDPEARSNSDRVEIERQEPVSRGKLMKADDLLLKIANIILAGGASFCILMSFYVIYYYGWAAQRYFGAPFGILLYCVFPAALASLLFGFLRRSPKFKVNAALVCVSVAFSIYAAELLLAFFMSSSSILWGDGDFDENTEKEIVALAKKFGINFDTRTRFEVVNDFRKRNIEAVPSIIPVGLLKKQADNTFKSRININGIEFFPVGGISERVTVLCNESGKYAIYDSDERGFHNPKGIWGLNRVAIVGVGDSFTQGNCVSSDKNFMALIRNQYPGTLNLGMSGEGPLIMLVALTEYLPAVRPKAVLWFFYEGNDLNDLLKESRTPLLRKYLEGNFSQGLFKRQVEIDEALLHYVQQHMKAELAKKKEEAKKLKENKNTWFDRPLGNFLRLSRLRQRLGLVYGQAIGRSYAAYSQSQLDLFRSVLLRAKTLVEAWGGKLYFVYLPDRDRYANKQDYHRQSILAVVETTGIPVIDVHGRFQRESDPLALFPFGRFGHYNEEGNRLVAEEVLGSIDLR